MWERYCRGVQAIVFVVDSADLDSLGAAKEELHTLLAKPSQRPSLLHVHPTGRGGSWCWRLVAGSTGMRACSSQGPMPAM